MDTSVRQPQNGISKSDAINILDRTIGFINTCDNKASIILGVVGVVFAIVFTSDGVVLIRDLILSAIELNNLLSVLYLCLLVASMLFLVFGVLQLITVLIARIEATAIKEDLCKDYSVIFFGDIIKKYTFKKYCEKMTSLTNKALLDDILREIYINAAICNLKFKKYNRGVIFSLSGLIGQIILCIVGVCLL